LQRGSEPGLVTGSNSKPATNSSATEPQQAGKSNSSSNANNSNKNASKSEESNEVTELLDRIGCSKFSQQFRKKHITTTADLLVVTDEDLKRMQITFNERTAILNEIETLRHKDRQDKQKKMVDKHRKTVAEGEQGQLVKSLLVGALLALVLAILAWIFLVRQ